MVVQKSVDPNALLIGEGTVNFKRDVGLKLLQFNLSIGIDD